MAKRIIREDTVSHERWMVSYADFLTLLLAFFVVMYAVSQRNEDKFRVLSRTLSEAFNMPERSINPIQVGEPVTAVNPGNVPDAIESPEQLPGSGRVDEDEPKATTSEPQQPEEFRRISQRVEEQFADLVARDLDLGAGQRGVARDRAEVQPAVRERRGHRERRRAPDHAGDGRGGARQRAADPRRGLHRRPPRSPPASTRRTGSCPRRAPRPS